MLEGKICIDLCRPDNQNEDSQIFAGPIYDTLKAFHGEISLGDVRQLS